ncbi:hypothetical protein AAAC51_04080 [Priestia megaterium]
MMKKKLAVISTACLLILASDPIPSYATPDSPIPLPTFWTSQQTWIQLKM